MKLRTENKRKAAYNIGLAIWRLKYFYETYVQRSTLVILLNFCANTPSHRQAEKRYPQPYGDSANLNRQCKK